LIEGAARVLEREGYAESLLTDIGAEAGSTTGAIYFHFRSKHELALAVIAEQNARTFGALSVGLENQPGFGGLIEASKLFVDLLLTDAVVRAGIRLSLEQSSIAAETAGYYREWIGSLESVFDGFQALGELRADVTPRAASRAVVPFFTGVHLVSDIIDQFGHVYEDMLEMWRILVRGVVALDSQDRLLAEAASLFEQRQPDLTRRQHGDDSATDPRR
jgi:AcrR family transcriptional regulator